MTHASGLTVRDVGSPDRHRLLLAGELDIASAPILEAAIEGLCENGTGTIVLDLSQLTFMDSTGLRAVLAADRLCNGNGHGLSLAGANGAVQRLFELTGVTGALRFETEDSGGDRSDPAARS
jgi:anti-sigma B factor antagonist